MSMPPKRILHVTNYYPPHAVGSYERQAETLINALEHRGHQVRVLTSTHVTNRYAPQLDRPVFRELPLQPDLKGKAFAFKQLYRLERDHADCLTRHISQFRPEIIVFWGMSGLCTSLVWTAARSGIPMVLAVYDFWMLEHDTHNPWHCWWYGRLPFTANLIRSWMRNRSQGRRILRKYPAGELHKLPLNTMFFCSNPLKSIYRGQDLAPVDAAVLPCCVDRAESLASPNFDRGLRRLLFVGRLNRDKDPLTAIRAVEELRHRGQVDFSLDLYGRGDLAYENFLHDKIRKSQLSGSIVLKTTAGEEEEPRWASYDMLVFTSRYPEPFPLSSLKAMSARVPVVSTLEGGSSDLIRDGENALTFRAGDHRDLADKIIKLADDIDLYEKLTNKAFDLTQTRYSIPVVADGLEIILQRAIEEHAQSTGSGSLQRAFN